MNTCDVAIIGAGPYGLSIAAHLKALGVNFRIFGNPMHTWLSHMPKGMRLKSEGFASTLYDPDSTFTLEAYCKEKGIPYRDLNLPVHLEVFSAYGLEFQKRLVPELEDKLVTSLKRTAAGFEIGVEGGDKLIARRVVMAIGLTHYAFLPPELSGFPESLVTHSSKHRTADEFRGREVTVVGGGSSASDLAALLYQSGAKVQILARKSVFRFHDPPVKQEPSLWDKLSNPMTGIGPGWKLYFYANAPLIFHKLPVKSRLDRVKRLLGPASCWFTKEQIVGKVPIIVDSKIIEAKAVNGRISLQIKNSAGELSTIVTDHVFAATGYKVNLERLSFLNVELKSAIRSVENTPVLSPNFESTVSGLYFVGASAANSFGPLLRFAFGAGYTAKRLSKHLAKTAVPGPIPSNTLTGEEASEHAEVAVH